MTIKVSYTYASPVYINIGYGTVDGGAVWGDITGTLSNQADLQAALNAKFNNPTGTTLQYLRGDGSLATFPLTLPVLQQVRNQSGTTMNAGEVVYINGATGNLPTIARAIANADATSAQTLGMVQTAIANNGTGYVVVLGTLGYLDTSAYTEGQQLYLSGSVAGGVTTTKQLAPIHLVYVGIVTRSHPTLGTIEVKVQNGYELDEIHDVQITSPTNGQVLKYNSATQLWQNSSDTDTGITSLNGLTALSQTFATGTSGTDFNISSATSTHTFNLPSASATNRGLLTSADWSTFNGKENVLTFSSPLSRSTNTISIPQATGSVNGFLSSTDWTTFNNKQNALTNPITGTGTTNYLPRFTGTSALGNSVVFQGTRALGLQTATPVDWGVGSYFLNIYDDGISGIHLTNLTTGQVSSVGMRMQSLNNDFIFINNQATGNIRWLTNSTERMRLFATGNLAINSTTDSGQRLQVIGDTLMRGSGNTSATTALTVQNSAGTNMWRFLNDGQLLLGSNASGAVIFPSGTDGILNIGGLNTTFYTSVTTQTFGVGAFNFWGTTLGATSGFNTQVSITRQFAPTSGNAAMYYLTISPSINQTGGANGITRGLYVNPTLTAAADWRSIEWNNSTGWGLYGAGTANNYMAGSLGIGSTNLAGYVFRISKSITGGANAIGAYIDGAIQNDVTSQARGFQISPSIASGTAVTDLIYYFARQNTFTGTATNQFGFFVDNNLTGATFNYSYFGNMPSGTGRWNLYMIGTADNYLAGSLGLGTTSLTGYKFIVIGNTYLAGTTNYIDGLTIFRNASAVETIRLFASNNVGIGTGATDSGQRLQVIGDTLLKGSGNTSATTALTVQNSDGSSLFLARNDGSIFLTSNTGARIYPSIAISGVEIGATGLAFDGRAVTRTAASSSFWFFVSNNSTAAAQSLMNFGGGFTPTSGTATWNSTLINTTINQTGGASGITRGLLIAPTLTAAADWRSIEWSNNTGWGLYGSGSASNYIEGSLGIGTTSLTGFTLRLGKTLTGGVNTYAVYQNGVVQSDSTTSSNGFFNALQTQAAVFNISNYRHFFATQGTIGAGSTITNQYAFWSDDITAATNNFGFYGSLSSGANKWNLYMNGTANNYLAGSLGIGTTSLSNTNINVTKNLTGSVNYYGIYNSGSIRSDVTSSAQMFSSAPSIQNTAFTLSVLKHYEVAGISTVGSATITSQFGFLVDSNLTGATNNYGFYGNIASGTGRWNLYMNGTALNYLNGSLLIGSTTDSGEKLQVTGTARITGASTLNDNLTIVKNTNGYTRLILRNTTSGTDAIPYLTITTGAGDLSSFNIGKYSASTTTYKFVVANDAYLSNITNGDIAILNDFASGSIKMAAGGSSTAQFTIASTGAATFSSSVTAASYTINDAGNITIGTTTGTKIGTATSQKLSFWNATPIVQPTTAVAAAAFVANTGTAVNDASTFDGYTMAQVVKALRNAGLLA